MDRFIVLSTSIAYIFPKYLKSNMDRFIVLADYNTKMGTTYLKSNMDRFIDGCGIYRKRKF